MPDPPGTTRRQPSHPRRPPAHKSVSLRHSPPISRQASKAAAALRPQATALSSPAGPASDKANPPSSISPNLTANKQSSGESSDAGKWFENTNNNAVQSNASFVDNDPPFFLRNSSSSGTPPDGPDGRSALQQQTSMPYRPGLTHLPTDGSSTEDFRSVIDDLTVVNKRLKQKLRKYEKLYDAHLQDEKLFEVRFHGLPDHKKKELEDVLRKFTSDLDDGPHGEYPPVSYAPQLSAQKTASSHTSRFAESGYASLSASGQNSTSHPSNQMSNQVPGQEGDHQKLSKSQYNRNQQNVQSYLHDIPAGLLPKNQVPMTEKSRKRLVVRRLEQIFAGKQSAPGSHPQPMQQEEVAQSAAMADRHEREATGQRFKKEGAREAHIMPVRGEDEDAIGHAPEALQKLRPLLAISEQDFAGSWSPDQRPTRPLDLDPYRAQVPAENMEYIRHLGFSPPDMFSEHSPDAGHGWLYLNLLINMAQLHTFNVTPDFVKDAVTEYSSKLELSRDGRKIRWKGGYGVTRNSSDSSSENPSGNSPYDVVASSTSQSPSKKLKTGHSGSSESFADPERQARRKARALKEQDQNKFMYTPLFFHKEDTDEDEDVYNIDMNSSSNSLFHAQQRGDSSGFGSSAMQSSSSKKRRDDGPIIFYKAKFCTDLTGDRRGLSVANPASYKSLTTQPLGVTAQPGLMNHTSGLAEPRGPMDITPMEVDLKDGERISSSDEDLGFSPEALRNDNGNDSPETMEFEASGLGGVQPDDNFAIKVKRCQMPSTQLPKRRTSQLYPKKIMEALEVATKAETRDFAASPGDCQGIKEEILSASRKSLPSSLLPTPSFLPFDSTSSGDVDSDLDSDVSSAPSSTSSSDQEPETALQLLNISPAHAGQTRSASPASNGDEDEEESDSDDSVDMLATARKLDPTTVRASEREYDAAIADRLRDEIPAGSSAATAGGGSGFNSPASESADFAAGEGSGEKRIGGRRRTKRQSTTSGSMSSRAKNLKRTRTSDSLAAANQIVKASKTPKID